MSKLPEIHAEQTQSASFTVELDEEQIEQVLRDWFAGQLYGTPEPPLYDAYISPSDVTVRISGGGGSLVSASLSLDVKAEVSDG